MNHRIQDIIFPLTYIKHQNKILPKDHFHLLNIKNLIFKNISNKKLHFHKTVLGKNYKTYNS
jgi:hypothetical protein